MCNTASAAAQPHPQTRTIMTVSRSSSGDGQRDQNRFRRGVSGLSSTGLDGTSAGHSRGAVAVESALPALTAATSTELSVTSSAQEPGLPTWTRCRLSRWSG